MAEKAVTTLSKRRQFDEDFRRDAVQMLFDGHSVASVAERLGIKANLLYVWRRRFLKESGPVASSLEERVRQLEAELFRVERERDILKKALAIFGRMM
jgi:transposase